jgi:hydroxymethylglutaryl-CoA reductase (NADPH)
MPADHRHARDYLGRLLQQHSEQELAQRLAPKFGPPAARIPGGALISSDALERRWQILQDCASSREALLDPQTAGQMECYQRNIENFIGTVKVPVGLAGPLRVNGLFAQGDYYVPLATTEAALVASYSRGAQLLSEAGGCSSMLLSEGLTRAPAFVFRNLQEAGSFVAWALTQQERFKKAAEETTQHGKLTDLRITVEGNHVYFNFEFLTGDASGQNMVTIATDAICQYIRAHSPVQPQYHFVEANMSGDKKASAYSYLLVRGKRVTAEATLSAELIMKRLHTTPEQMVNYWRVSAMGGVLSGTLGVQGDYANGLAAIYIACGQDVACVAESAVGLTRFELSAEGALYAAVTLPSIMVGTVGGGTGLPSQKACLEILGLSGANKAQAFAEVCGAAILAGELSIIGALSAGEFTRAHQRLARGRRKRMEDGK